MSAKQTGDGLVVQRRDACLLANGFNQLAAFSVCVNDLTEFFRRLTDFLRVFKMRLPFSLVDIATPHRPPGYKNV